MCRLAAFPPGFGRDEAIRILKHMEGMNKDGVGQVHVRPDGRFMVTKYPGSLSGLLSKEDGKNFLAHMPYDGWTIVHLRMATHGEAAVRNTHPFTAGEWCLAHNGIWTAHKEVRALLKQSTKFLGDTDSETAAHFLNTIGPKKFEQVMDSGVYLALNRNGKLWLLKVGGSIESKEIAGKFVLATDIAVDKGVWPNPMHNGWYRFSAKGIPEGQSKDAGIGYYKSDTNYRPVPRTPPHLTEEQTEGQVIPFGPDGFPAQRPHCSGNGNITVPRDRPTAGGQLDWDSMSEEEWQRHYDLAQRRRNCMGGSYEDRGFPHYAGEGINYRGD